MQGAKGSNPLEGHHGIDAACCITGFQEYALYLASLGAKAGVFGALHLLRVPQNTLSDSHRRCRVKPCPDGLQDSIGPQADTIYALQEV